MATANRSYARGLAKGTAAFGLGYVFFPISKAVQGAPLSLKPAALKPPFGFDSMLNIPAAVTTILGLTSSAAADGVEDIGNKTRAGLRIVGYVLSAMAGNFLAQAQIDPPEPMGPPRNPLVANEYKKWIPYRAPAITMTNAPGTGTYARLQNKDASISITPPPDPVYDGPYMIKDVYLQAPHPGNMF